MKRSFLLLFSLFFATLTLAGESDPYSSMVNSIDAAQKEVKTSGVVRGVCTDCQRPDTVEQKVDLNGNVITLDTPFIYKDNTPYTIHLKRTKESPSKIVLKFKNGHKECARFSVESNPYNGALTGGCWMYHTVYVDEKIELNLKKWKAGDEDQIIELKMIKPNADKSKYNLEVAVLNGITPKISKDEKFWKDGFSLSFESRKQDE